LSIVQSDVVNDPAPLADKSETTLDHQENFVFDDIDSGAIVDIAQSLEESYAEHEDEAASLAKYLERPVKIDSFTWNESDAFTLTPRTIYPWRLFFDNAYIKNKLQNFSRLHCTLKLTFRFNASPFYYGSMRACYDPLSSGRFDPVTAGDLVSLSQTPGVYMDPQEATMTEITLPFLYPSDWIDTVNASNFEGIGKIMFVLFAQLRSANGASGTGITITTYAQAQDVVVSGPTVVSVLQSGIISGPASAIATAAGTYESHAKVGPYAKAIRVGATLVSSVARMFGFSNAPTTEDVRPVQNKVYHGFANVETSMPLDKLAIDPKNEVVIDSRSAGVDATDELEISAIVTRPSFVGTVDWTSAQAAGARLMFGQVSPAADNYNIQPKVTYHNLTPASWVANMFRFWRGSMKLHFKVVRSQYQKGRLMVNWDPNGALDATGVETALFTKVFDLASPEQGFDFIIPYKAANPWLQTTSATVFSSTNPGYSVSNTNGNWQLSIINALTGPTVTNAVTILLYVSAGDDMEFAAPDPVPYWSTQVVQSGAVDGPIDGGQAKESTRLHEFTVGERVLSLRALLHRTTLSLQQAMGVYATQNVLAAGHFHATNYFPRIPLEPGFSPILGVNLAQSILGTPATPIAANFSKMHPINWVLSAFVGYRGSVNVHANITTNGNISDISDASISRTNHSYISHSGSNQRNSDFTNDSVTVSLASIANRAYQPSFSTPPLVPTGDGGMTVTNGKTQMALSANIPQYCPARFYPAWVTQRDVIQTVGTAWDGFRVDVDANIVEGAVANATLPPLLKLYYSAGVDFNPIFFVGVPRLNQYSLTPFT
jgi:hypothetical protein